MKIMDPPANTRELLIERVFNAPRELVFQAWTDPDHARQWFGPRDYPARELTMDVRPGGRWRSCLRSIETGNELWCHGVYREIVAPERLVFTFVWEEEGERGLETVVTITFAERDGETEHDAPPDAIPVDRRARWPSRGLDQRPRPAGRPAGRITALPRSDGRDGNAAHVGMPAIGVCHQKACSPGGRIASFSHE